jgi:hypothetical protein
VEHGLAMRASPAPYVRPAGFLFIYFVLQLFSENLLIFGLALFCYLTRLGFVDHRRWARIAALAILGAILLVRPNALLLVPGALA